MSARDVILEAIRANWIKNDTAPVSETDAILSALEAAGYAVVPKEPTEAMIDAPRGLFLFDGPPNTKWTLGQHTASGGYPLAITEREKSLSYVNKATRAIICWRTMLTAAKETK